MADSFHIFSLVHSVVTSPERLRRITTEALQDFEKENCVYLELRTTPKNIANMAKAEYLQIITSEILKHSGKMITKLLISINRVQSLKDAWENFELAKTCEICVGLDFSGNPNVNKFKDFREVFEKAKEFGMKTTVHTGEIEDDEDTLEILQFGPDRLGHCVFLPKECENLIMHNKIPMEICPSSNMAGCNIEHMSQHHFGIFYQVDHPMCVCTDDTLLFDTNLTKELELVVQAYDLTINQVKNIIENTAAMAFTKDVASLLT